jgi:hypothetical protein
MTRPWLMGFLGLAVALSGRAAADEPPNNWQPYLEFHADLASGQDAAGGAAIFVPIWQDRHSILFGDFRGQAGGGENGNGGTDTGAAAGNVWIPHGSRRPH